MVLMRCFRRSLPSLPGISFKVVIAFNLQEQLIEIIKVLRQRNDEIIFMMQWQWNK